MTQAHILVVDDEPDIRHLVSEILEDEGYRVTVAEDACFDRSQASHAISLCDMHAKYADVRPAADALGYLE